MQAELIAVGRELLWDARTDFCSEWLTRELGGEGIEVSRRTVIGNDIDPIAAVLRGALDRADVIVVTGGLGPMGDDRTRHALARSLGVPLDRDPEELARLQRCVADREIEWTPEQAGLADRPCGCSWIANPIGCASGLQWAEGRILLAALPGGPPEMRAMFMETVLPALRSRGTRATRLRTLRVAGRSEAWIEREVRDLTRASSVEVTISPGVEGVDLVLHGRGSDERQVAERLRSLERELRERLGHDVYGAANESLAAVVGDLLLRSSQTLATAESCTAGGLAAAVTAVPGASRWYRGGIVVYADDLKRTLAGVDSDLLERHGAVSSHVARALARGVRDRCVADLGVGITGIAGPSGGTSEKPVGLVHLALADANESWHWNHQFAGDRATVRQSAVNVALDQLRRHLVERASA